MCELSLPSQFGNKSLLLFFSMFLSLARKGEGRVGGDWGEVKHEKRN